MRFKIFTVRLYKLSKLFPTFVILNEASKWSIMCPSVFIVYDVCYLGLSGFKLTWVVCRAGELSAAELDNLMVIVANPRQFRIPDWFLNRKKDYKDGRYSQVVSNALDMKLRDDLERLKKIRFVLSKTFFHTYIWTNFWKYRLHFDCFHIFFVPIVGLLNPPLNYYVIDDNWQESPWSSTLLGSSCSWATHQDNWSQGKDRWCL